MIQTAGQPKIKTIAEILGDQPKLNGKLCIDACNRLWEIKVYHSSVILKGVNTEAVIPYWTSYAIGLEGLKLTNTDSGLPLLEDEPTILKELLRLSLEPNDIVIDSIYGYEWRIKLASFLYLDGIGDNYHLPGETLGVLSLGELQTIY